VFKIPQNLPYVVYGTVTDSNSALVASIRVTARNDTSGETTNATTNASGEYAIDLANLTSGYVNTDRITIICSYGLEEQESSFLISADTHSVNLTLVVRTESTDVTYCQLQDVYDELDGKTTSDISYNRVRKAILRAEAEIDERTKSKFSATLVSDEIYDFNQYTSYKSPDQLIQRQSEVLVGNRSDHWNTYFNDKFRLNKSPLVNLKTQLNGVTTTTATTLTVDSTTGFPTSGTIFIYNSTNGVERIDYTGTTSTTFTGLTRSSNSTTASAHADNAYVTMMSISKNEQGDSAEDDWEDLEPQRGGGGDYLAYNDTGHIVFVDNVPALGSRKLQISYTYGYVTVPTQVQDLCILLAVRKILLAKGHGSTFDSVDDISIGDLSISGAGGSVSYMRWLKQEIDDLWKTVGDLAQDTA